MNTKVATTVKRCVAAGGLALGLLASGGFAGTAFADPTVDEGTYDDNLDLALETCWGEIPGGGSHAVDTVNGASSAGCDHNRTSDS